VSGPDRNGSEPLSDGRAQASYGTPRRPLKGHGHSRTHGTIFSGTAGALATSPGQCELPPTEVAALIDEELEFAKLAELAFMFNFHDGMLSLGHQRICVQLWDGTGVTKYASDWSQGLSLDSVGFSQVAR
jgi:hypothetical protein